METPHTLGFLEVQEGCGRGWRACREMGDEARSCLAVRDQFSARGFGLKPSYCLIFRSQAILTLILGAHSRDLLSDINVMENSVLHVV